MVNKKRMLVSLGAGILLFVIGFLSLSFICRLVNSPAWMLNGMLWMLGWPIRILFTVGCIPYPERGGAALILSVGTAADIAILTQLVYVVLSRFNRKSHQTSPPPLPPVLH